MSRYLAAGAIAGLTLAAAVITWMIAVDFPENAWGDWDS